MKIVINKCYGGFDFSLEAWKRFAELKGVDESELLYREIERDDPDLVRVVEEFGDKVNSMYSDLKVVDIPDDVDWVVRECDGMEWVEDVNRVWR